MILYDMSTYMMVYMALRISSLGASLNIAWREIVSLMGDLPLNLIFLIDMHMIESIEEANITRISCINKNSLNSRASYHSGENYGFIMRKLDSFQVLSKKSDLLIFQYLRSVLCKVHYSDYLLKGNLRFPCLRIKNVSWECSL